MACRELHASCKQMLHTSNAHTFTHTFTNVTAGASMLLQPLLAFSAEQCYGAGAESLMLVYRGVVILCHKQ